MKIIDLIDACWIRPPAPDHKPPSLPMQCLADLCKLIRSCVYQVEYDICGSYTMGQAPGTVDESRHLMRIAFGLGWKNLTLNKLKQPLYKDLGIAIYTRSELDVGQILESLKANHELRQLYEALINAYWNFDMSRAELPQLWQANLLDIGTTTIYNELTSILDGKLVKRIMDGMAGPGRHA